MNRRWAVLAVAGMTVAAGVAAEQGAPGTVQFRELARKSLATLDGDVRLAGLRADVRVARDQWGVPHIYAQNVDDLFFAQGYVMAQDRLWQMEVWRRTVEGRLAEILGPAAVERDRRARLFKYRGPMDDREWTSYHPEGKRIFTAYAAGINAYIAERATNLPIEFVLTGITPTPWTAATVVARVAVMGDASGELTLARNVARLGAAEANKQRAPDPWDELKVPPGLDVALIDEAAGGGRGGGGGGVRPAIIEPYRAWIGRGASAADAGNIGEPGSNNWVVGGKMSPTGKPIVANDPHRDVTNPSLRYIVHLNAPGWNVIGAGEPPFVGVAVGHNDRLGWGLTIAGNDQEDVFIEEVNPANANEVKYRGAWEPLTIVREEIAVKGEAPRAIELKFSRHGPVFFEDAARQRVYALHSALLEPGTAPYLGNLRLAQAANCRDFLAAAMYWKAPTENLICGDVDGNIAWQASALTPNRKGWNGRLPVPGTGEYEWDGFRSDLPRDFNPARGFIATANNNIHPPGFDRPVMFKSATTVPFDRITRLLQMIQPGRTYSIDDHRNMQLDTLSLRAQSELPLFRGWTSSKPEVERARALVAAWDGRLAKESSAAAVYSAWRTASAVAERDTSRLIADRQPLHETSLTRAIERLSSEQGADPAGWRWGRMHTRAFPHPFVSAFDLDTVERPGGTGALAADGASYREVLDVADWDRSIVTNVPGQSGQPESPFYGNLLPLWAGDSYFPLVFSAARVAAETKAVLNLRHR